MFNNRQFYLGCLVKIKKIGVYNMIEMKNKKITPSIKKKFKKSSSRSVCLRKVKLYQNIIQDSILCVQKYKTLDIIDAGELNVCIQSLENLYVQTQIISTLYISQLHASR